MDAAERRRSGSLGLVPDTPPPQNPTPGTPEEPAAGATEPPAPGAPERPATGIPEGRRSYRRWRDWLLPRSVLGITSLLLAGSIGASVSGAALYSYYEYRLTNSEKKVDNYVTGFDKRFRTASDTLDAEKQNAQAEIQRELEPLKQSQAEGGTMAALVQKVNKSIWFVQTLDEAGAPLVGSAFVVESDGQKSVLVTSYSTIKASTHAPAPAITLTKGADKVTAHLDNWVEGSDLAVVTIPKGNLPKLDWITAAEKPRVGDRVFVGSGLGSGGASITQGFISDASDHAIQHDAAVGSAFQGGPLLTSDGKVSGVASQAYAPYNFTATGGITYGIPIRDTCDKLLSCPPDRNSASGSTQH